MRVIIREAVSGQQSEPMVIADFTFDTKWCPWVQYLDLPATKLASAAASSGAIYTMRYRLEFYPSQEGEIDYRQLLKAYLIRVADREGVYFIANHHADTVQFTDAEIAELHRLSDD